MNKKKSYPNYKEFYHWVTEGYFSKIKIERDKERIVKTNEIFTSLDIVICGLELAYPSEIFSNLDISYSDNCVGEGAWLVGMALLRMKSGLSHEDAIQNLKGVDVMEDNVQACRERLLCGQEHLRHIVEQNIVCADALRYHYRFDGSYPYDDEAKAQEKEERFKNLFSF